MKTNKIINLLNYVGTLGAIITAIAYIIFMAILVAGIQSSMQANQLLLVSISGALAGVGIMVMLRYQGIAFAEQEEGIKRVIDEYNTLTNKKKQVKKLATINKFMIVQILKDIFIKSITIASTTYFSINIFMEGNGDITLIGLAFVNVLMFTCFGILALAKTYNFYLNEHINALKTKITKLKEGTKNETNQ